MRDERLGALVEHLISLPAETTWVEFKRNRADPDAIGRLASALSNSAKLADRPYGYVVWGVEDGSQTPVGTTFEPAREKKGNQPLEFWLAAALKPSLSIRFQTVDHDNGRLVLLEVPAASSVPAKYQDIPYMRIGSATPKLADYPEREAELLSKLRPLLWEQGTAASFLTDEEIFQLLNVSSYFRLTKQQLPRSRAIALERLAEDRLIERDVGGRWNIRNVAAILFARRLSSFDLLSRKAPRVVQYDGVSKARMRKQREGVRGYAAGFEPLIDFIDGLLPGGEDIGQALRIERRTYPQIAIRELVANALVHQDMTVRGAGPVVELYDDRVEVSNPGAPVTDMLRKLFGAPPRSRNEATAALMRRMGICEELGSGLVKTIAAIEDYRLPAPEFSVTDGSTRVVLFGPQTFADMDRSQRVRVCYQHTALRFHKREYMTNASLRDRLGIDPRNAAQVSRVIRDTIAMGLIRPHDEERPRAGYVPFWA